MYSNIVNLCNTSNQILKMYREIHIYYIYTWINARKIRGIRSVGEDSKRARHAARGTRHVRNVAQCYRSIGFAGSESRWSSFKFSAPRLKHTRCRCLLFSRGRMTDDGWRMTLNTVTGRWHGYSMVGNGSSMAVNGALITQNRRLVYGCCVSVCVLRTGEQTVLLLSATIYILAADIACVHTRMCANASLRQSLVPRCNNIMDAFARLMKFPPVPLCVFSMTRDGARFLHFSLSSRRVFKRNFEQNARRGLRILLRTTDNTKHTV